MHAVKGLYLSQSVLVHLGGLGRRRKQILCGLS